MHDISYSIDDYNIDEIFVNIYIYIAQSLLDLISIYRITITLYKVNHLDISLNQLSRKGNMSIEVPNFHTMTRSG